MIREQRTTLDDDGFKLESYSDTIEKLLAQLSRFPPVLSKSLGKELRELLKLVNDDRPARFVLVGRRGSGKSTLINAIFGSHVAEPSSVVAGTASCEWRTHRSDAGRTIEILDTRGVQEAAPPEGAVEGKTSEDSILDSVRERSPDAVLYLHKAKEVGAAMSADLDSLENILSRTKRIHGFDLPVLGVVTQADELDPPDIRQLPTDDEEKNENIRMAVNELSLHLEGRPLVGNRLVKVVPTVAYMRFRRDGSIGADFRWNIDELVRLLVEELPEEAKLGFSRLARVRTFQRKVARSAVAAMSSACGVIGTEPIPAADLPILAGIQATMVVTIAYISGRELALRSAREFMGAVGIQVGAGFILRETARGLIKLIPGWGSVVSGAVAALGTAAIGEAAIAYYIDDKGSDEAKKELLRRRHARRDLPC